jgi:hypothetical protein
MNDRLKELGAANWADSSDNDAMPEGAPGGGDVEMGNVGGGAPKQAKHMEHFFREVESIKTDIEGVKAATKEIGDINEAALQATTTDQENELSNQLRPLVENTNKRAKRTKNLLGLLKEENKKLKDEGTAKTSDLRYVRFLCARSNLMPLHVCRCLQEKRSLFISLICHILPSQ